MVDYIFIPSVVVFGLGVAMFLTQKFLFKDSPPVPSVPPPEVTPTITHHGIVVGPASYYQEDINGDRVYVTTISVDSRDGELEVSFSWDDDEDSWRLPLFVFVKRFKLNTEQRTSLVDLI